MSYSEQDGQVVLTMSPICANCGLPEGKHLGPHQWCKKGNLPGAKTLKSYTPYQVETKK